jgi:uncharacterized membrane protein
VSNVREKPDLVLAVCCAASLILVPLFVIGVTLLLFTIAVTGEIVERFRGRKAVFADTRSTAQGMCHGG